MVFLQVQTFRKNKKAQAILGNTNYKTFLNVILHPERSLYDLLKGELLIDFLKKMYLLNI